MKKMKWIEKLAGIIAAGALISFTMTGLLGCNQTLDDEDERSTTGGSTPGASSGSTGGTVENLTVAKTLKATENTGYTVKLGCDASAMKVTSVKYNGSELMPANTAYTLENLSFSGVNVSGLSADTWSVEYTYTMTKVGTQNWEDYNFEISDGNTENKALGYWSLRYDNYAVGYLNGYHEYGTWTSEHVDGVSASDAAYGGHWYGMENKIENFDHSQSLNKTLVMKIEKTDSAFVITIKSNGTEIWKCTNDKAVSSGESGSGESTGGEGTGVTVENLTAAKTLSATANAGYTVKLGCDGSAMKVTSVKYNGSELMPANTAYTLENLSFSGVNVSGLSADTWSVEYAYTMTKVGTDAWSDYNFEIADGNTENGALGYWSLRYDNYAVGYLNGYHEYGTWTSEHVEGVASSDAAYGGHWYGMNHTLKFDHSESLNKKLVMKIEKTASAFVITITSDGTEVWKCTNDKAVSSGNSGDSGNSGTGEESGENTPETIPTETDYVVGTEDCTSSWTPGKNYTIASGETQTVYFKNYGKRTGVYNPGEGVDGYGNWNNFLVELWNADSAVCGVTLRADNYGWNYGESAEREFSYANVVTTGTSLPASWETWVAAINGATVKLEVSYKDGTITFKATSADVEGWAQVYSFTGCTSSSLNWHFNVDCSYLVVLK